MSVRHDYGLTGRWRDDGGGGRGSVSGCVLSDGDAELLQHPGPFLLVLVPRHPEVVFVLHDVSQHGTAQEHHVFTPRGVLYPDLEFLPRREEWSNDAL